jgi:hypothetical protein
MKKIEEEQQQLITYETTLKCNQEQLLKKTSELDGIRILFNCGFAFNC